MHPRNNLRLLAGLPMDMTLEKTQREPVSLREAREVPRKKSELSTKSVETYRRHVNGVTKAIQHLENAIKALERIPAHDFNGDIPHYVHEIEEVLGVESDDGMRGLLQYYSDELKNRESEKVTESVILEDHFKKGTKLTDNKGKCWKVVGYTGKGEKKDDEVYKLECSKTGEKTTRKYSEIKDWKKTETLDEMVGYEREEGSAEGGNGSEEPERFDTSKDFKKGEKVLYDNGIWVVHVTDAQADLVGLIPPSMANASEDEKARAMQQVKRDKIRKPSEEECEVMAFESRVMEADSDDWLPELKQAVIDLGVDPNEAKLIAASESEWEKIYTAPDYPHEVTKVWGNVYRLGNTNTFVARVAEATGEINETQTFSVTVTNRSGSMTHSFKVKALNEAEARKKATEYVQEKYIKSVVSESTYNYTPSNAITYGDSSEDPVNVVGQGEGHWKNSLNPETVKDEYPTQMDNRGDQSMDDYANKVKVPSRVTKSLRDAIKAFEDEAEAIGTGGARAETRQFYNDSADAFQTLLDYIEQGTIQSVKNAQSYAQSLMGPMLHKIPDEVWDFLTYGGGKRSLKDYMTPVSKKFPIMGPRNTQN